MSNAVETPDGIRLGGASGDWDTSYEWKAVLLLSIGFGLVGIDRFLIMPLFPVIMKSLHLNYQDLGRITGVLSLGWGIAAIFMGSLSDRIGHRRVVIPALVLFSLLAGLSGLATTVLTLMMVRVLMGFLEGAYAPASIIATIDASKPSRHGRNVGLQQALSPLLGQALTPIIVTQLLLFMSWRAIFTLVTLPGLIVAFFLWKYLRNTDPKAAVTHTSTHDVAEHRWSDVLKYRNIVLNIIGMACWLTVLVVLTAFFPNYLIDYLHLDMQQMGLVLSAIGFGATAGTIAIPMASDWIGRKITVILSVPGAALFLFFLSQTGARPTLLFVYLMMTLFFIFGMIALTVGPISAESVPVKLMSSASGLVIGIGELFGGFLAPLIAGDVAQNYGIQHTLDVGFFALAIGFLVALSLKETLPSRQKA